MGKEGGRKGGRREKSKERGKEPIPECHRSSIPLRSLSDKTGERTQNSVATGGQGSGRAGREVSDDEILFLGCVSIKSLIMVSLQICKLLSNGKMGQEHTESSCSVSYNCV